MVPREIFNYATSRGAAHLLNNFGMSMQMLECCCDRVDVTGLHDNSFHAIAHHIACFARGDLGQRTCRGFICHFGAAFPLRGLNMLRALAKIILRITLKYSYSTVISPHLFKNGTLFS